MSADSLRCDTGASADIAFFLADSFTDYLAARVLLLSGLPKQGAVLGSTAVEKSIKAVLAIERTFIKSHVSQKHWDALVKMQPTLAAELRLDFILLCERVYLLRYTGDPPAGFNVVVASQEFLAELDETVCRIQLRFALTQLGKVKQSAFDVARSTKDQRLWQGNCFLAGMSRTAQSHKPQIVYEARQRQKRGALVELQYTSSTPAQQPGFLRPRAQLGSDGKSWTLSHVPDLQ